MSDINQFMRHPEATDPDVLDRLEEIGDWDRGKAEQLARTEGIDMTDDHWEVIHFLRDHYKNHGKAKSGRQLSEILDDKFDNKGGRKFLYQLFPDGPVVQGSRIAGTPLPEYAKDDSFGYSQ